MTQRPCPVHAQELEAQTTSEQVVDVEVDSGLFYLFEFGGAIPTMYLRFELEVLREGIKQHIGLCVVEDLLPHVLQPQPHVVHCSDEVNWVATWFHRLGEKYVPARTTGYSRVAVETPLQGVPSGGPVADAAQLLALVRPHSDVRGSFGHEE